MWNYLSVIMSIRVRNLLYLHVVERQMDSFDLGDEDPRMSSFRTSNVKMTYL
jgi:hypothetical protein